MTKTPTSISRCARRWPAQSVRAPIFEALLTKYSLGGGDRSRGCRNAHADQRSHRDADGYSADAGRRVGRVVLGRTGCCRSGARREKIAPASCTASANAGTSPECAAVGVRQSRPVEDACRTCRPATRSANSKRCSNSQAGSHRMPGEAPAARAARRRRGRGVDAPVLAAPQSLP